MFSSYGGASSRSKSTTDIFRASSDLDDVSYPPVDYSRCRKNTNPAVIGRRRHIPVAPRRSDSSFAVNLEPKASSPKHVAGSYPTDEDVRLEADSTVLPTQLTQSPGSKNFVKKLVATLERRHREQQLGTIAPRIDLAGNELVRKKNLRNTVPGTRAQELKRDCVVGRFSSEQLVSRLPSTQLEDLDEVDEDWHELSPQFWQDEEERSSPATKSLPIHIIERKGDRNNNPTKSTTVKRTIKNMLSSILNWKISKSLPKGSREYYAARESLGEEMRAFRRDTMPRLMEDASANGKLEIAGAIRDEQREFSELIGSPNKSNLAEERSIATIHPVYGNSSNLRRSWHEEKQQEVLYGSVKVQPPTPPPRASQLSPSSELQHLLRPSKVRDLQRRISRQSDSYSQVQLRTRACFSVDDQKRNSIVYDVPRSNRRVETAETDTYTADVLVLERERVPGYINRITPPEYANVSGIIATHDDDERLHCTAFTTF